MSCWSNSGTWTGDGLRREVFFFRSGGELLYGSLFAATEPSRAYGVVACNSWGVEADRLEPLQRSVALTMARLGGAGLVFHYPGYGDSYGELREVELASLSDAAVDAVAAASRRFPGAAWVLAGFALGASAASLAATRVAADALLLVQPALCPGAYFQQLASSSEPLAPGPGRSQRMMQAGTAPGMAYGYPIPSRFVDRAAEVDAAPRAALQRFSGSGAVVAHTRPQPPPPTPERLERIEVAGPWRFGSQNHPRLAKAAGEWLDRHTAATGLRDERQVGAA